MKTYQEFLNESQLPLTGELSLTKFGGRFINIYETSIDVSNSPQSNVTALCHNAMLQFDDQLKNNDIVCCKVLNRQGLEKIYWKHDHKLYYMENAGAFEWDDLTNVVEINRGGLPVFKKYVDSAKKSINELNSGEPFSRKHLIVKMWGLRTNNPVREQIQKADYGYAIYNLPINGDKSKAILISDGLTIKEIETHLINRMTENFFSRFTKQIN